MYLFWQCLRLSDYFPEGTAVTPTGTEPVYIITYQVGGGGLEGINKMNSFQASSSGTPSYLYGGPGYTQLIAEGGSLGVMGANNSGGGNSPPSAGGAGGTGGSIEQGTGDPHGTGNNGGAYGNGGSTSGGDGGVINTYWEPLLPPVVYGYGAGGGGGVPIANQPGIPGVPGQQGYIGIYLFRQ